MTIICSVHPWHEANRNRAIAQRPGLRRRTRNQVYTIDLLKPKPGRRSPGKRFSSPSLHLKQDTSALHATSTCFFEAAEMGADAAGVGVSKCQLESSSTALELSCAKASAGVGLEPYNSTQSTYQRVGPFTTKMRCMLAHSFHQRSFLEKIEAGS